MRARGIAEARDRPAPVRPRRGTPRASRRATCSRHATSRGQRRHSWTAALERRAARAALTPASASPACRTPRTSRSTTGSRSRMSSGSPVRIWRDASSTTAPTIAKASCERGEPRRQPVLGVLAVDVVDRAGVVGEGAVAALHRARPGADDLDEQRLGLVGEGGEHLEVGVDHGAHAARAGSVPTRGVGARPAHRLDHRLGARVEQRDDAVLLVVEVLVERRLRHPGLAGDRLRRRVGVAHAGEDGRRGGVEPAPLAVLAHLERRRVTAARCRVPTAHAPRWYFDH